MAEPWDYITALRDFVAEKFRAIASEPGEIDIGETPQQCEKYIGTRLAPNEIADLAQSPPSKL